MKLSVYSISQIMMQVKHDMATLFNLFFGGMSRLTVNLSVVHWVTSFYILLWVLSEGGIMLGVACILLM
jgi:hypothetical protein